MSASDKVSISKNKLFGLVGIVIIIIVVAFLIFRFSSQSANQLNIIKLSAQGYNLPLTTIYGWHVNVEMQNVGSNDIHGAEIKAELVCDGRYVDTETQNFDLSANWEKTTTLSVSGDRTTTNVLSANEIKVTVTISLNGVILDQQTLNIS